MFPDNRPACLWDREFAFEFKHTKHKGAQVEFVFMSCVCLQLFWETSDHFFELTFPFGHARPSYTYKVKLGDRCCNTSKTCLRCSEETFICTVICQAFAASPWALTITTWLKTRLLTQCCALLWAHYLTKTSVAFFYFILCSSLWAFLSYKEKLFSVNENVCRLYSDIWHCGEAEQKMLGLCLKSTFCFLITWMIE